MDAAAQQDLVRRITQARANVASRESQLTQHRTLYDQLAGEISTFGKQLRDEGIDPTKLDELIAESEAEVLGLLEEIERELHGQSQQA
jgi:hypothetical protein